MIPAEKIVEVHSNMNVNDVNLEIKTLIKGMCSLNWRQVQTSSAKVPVFLRNNRLKLVIKKNKKRKEKRQLCNNILIMPQNWNYESTRTIAVQVIIWR